MDFGELKMQNFDGEYPQGIERVSRMRNFIGEYLHVIENVGCRCKICKGSIFKSQKRQDADVIVHDRQA